MPIDWGFYSALKQPSLVEQEMAAKNQQLGFLKDLTQLKQQEEAQRFEAEAMVQQNMSKFAEVDALERDKTELMALSKKLESNILQGIATAGGDARRYLNTGGLGQLREYYTTMMQSKEMDKAINGKQYKAMYTDAINKGLFPNPDVLTISGEQKIVSAGKKLELYEKGIIPTLEWKGAEKLQPGPDYAKTPNPFGIGPHKVTVEEYYRDLLHTTQNPLTARMRAIETEDDNNPGYTTFSYAPNPDYYGRYASSGRYDFSSNSKTNRAEYDSETEKLKNYYAQFFSTRGDNGKLQPSPYMNPKDVIYEEVYDEKGEMIKLTEQKNNTAINFEILNNKNPMPSEIEDKIIDSQNYIDQETKTITFPPMQRTKVLGSKRMVQYTGTTSKSMPYENAEIVYLNNGIVTKNNQGKQNYDYHETAPFLAVTIKMSDVEADKYFADLETGNDIYNKRMLWWDTAPDAYKRAIQEDPEDVNAVRITFLKPIQYDELTSIGFNKPLEGSAEVPFTPRYDLGE